MKASPGDINHQLDQLISDELRSRGMVLQRKKLKKKKQIEMI